MPLPIPVKVSETPTIADLRTLIEIKLSSYLGSTLSRARDFGDVVELIRANRVPEDFELDPAVAPKYLETWRGLRQEQQR